MKLLLDENRGGLRLASRLQAQGHDPVLAIDVGKLKSSGIPIADRIHVLNQWR